MSLKENVITGTIYFKRPLTKGETKEIEKLLDKLGCNYISVPMFTVDFIRIEIDENKRWTIADALRDFDMFKYVDWSDLS